GSAAQPLVEGVVRSAVRLGNQASYAAIVFMYHVHGGVRRAAIDDYVLNLFVVLPRNGLQSRGYRGGTVVDRSNDRDFQCLAAACLNTADNIMLAAPPAAAPAGHQPPLPGDA